MSELSRLPMVLSASFGKFSKKIDRALSVHGISFTEFMVLHQVCNAPGAMMSRIALAEAINLTASGVTRLLNPMEKIHLVGKEKDARDARVSLVKATPSGIEIYRDARVTYQSCTESLVAHLSPEQQDMLVELLEALK